MAQSVRRVDIGMEHKPQRDKTRTSYFGNVKSRLGSKLPAGVSQPPHFAKPPWDTQPQARSLQEPSASHQHHQYQTAAGQPLDHIPHIRNPILRQYYLQGTSWDSNMAVKQEQTKQLSHEAQSSTDESVFNISSRFGSGDTAPPPRSQSAPLSAALVRMEQQQQAEEVKSTATAGSEEKTSPGMVPDFAERLAATAQSPLPEAEYDKLLDVEAVPMPDGQLCLLALPPECCQGEGPDATPYLKLFCRHITDRKGVVSGILLVTTNKLFFDPCKTHPLVKEHGCEEYLLSCSVDQLSSVSFYSDISHVHFHYSHQRRKGRKLFHRLKNPKSQDQKKESVSLRAPAELSTLSLKKEACAESDCKKVPEEHLDKNPSETSSEASGGALGVAATFCCGAPEVSSHVKTTDEARSAPASSQTAVPAKPSSENPRCVIFIRLRVQSSAGRKKKAGGFQFGMTETAAARREAWIALSQESSDELHAFLKRRRPDLCLLKGGGEEHGEAEHNEEEFVLLEDEEEEGVSPKQHSSGDDWEMVLMEDNGDKLMDREPEGLNAIVENSQILEASDVRELCKELPPKTVGHAWQLAYSTSRHGASLKSLYRKMSAADSPALVVIKDATDEVFGAFLSHPLRLSDAFYGTGETFLFMLHPRFKCFRWTGENSFFIKGDLDSFAIGGGSGHFGLWLDENLYLGRSSPCYTFNNCCLSETDDFRVMELEVWTFG
ncbi:nuclear receptor coactivator 7 isoform X1 [Syngnathus typhle]|uniref:nuclear receptor coactivator 7 isoform X1 n=2 Tax=Syngnathus typhle TaxID=161592 RepID=UPI002A69E71C|nr:nuclear receptor coactivator 7 isoform X1 [Syngnathus typhle]